MMMNRFSLCFPFPSPLRFFFFLALVGLLRAEADPSSGESPSEDIEALKYLPNGTSLVQVVLPRYDRDRKLSSVLKADKMSLLSKEDHLMEGLGVDLTLVDQEGDMTFKTTMQRCLYDYRKGLLDSQQKTVLESQTMYLEGQAAYYDLPEKRFFLVGPAQGKFIDKTLSSRLLCTLFSSLALLSSPADPPAPPEPSLLAEMAAQRAQPLRSSETQAAQKTHAAQKKERAQHISQLSETMQTGMSRFFDKVGSRAQLVQSREAALDKVPPAGKPALSKRLTAPLGALELYCEGGIYYDYEAGHLVCLKNVRVVDPRFELTCDKELKILLVSDPSPGAEQKEQLAGMSTGSVSEMIATGNVVITYKAVKGEPMIATGDSAHYEAKTEEILIDGGLPTFRQGPHFFEALEPTVWVKLSRKGFTTGPGKKRTVYLPKAPKKNE